MANKVIRIPHNWAPRTYQKNVWRYLENGGKRAICIWHRRAGKDDVCLHWAAAPMIDKPATYWHMLPAYSQGRKAIWTAVNPHTGKRRIDEAFPHELRANTNEQEMFIRLKNGATWQVLGSDRYDAAVGMSTGGHEGEAQGRTGAARPAPSNRRAPGAARRFLAPPWRASPSWTVTRPPRQQKAG